MRRSLAIAAACVWMTAGSLALAQPLAAEGAGNPEPTKNAKEEPKPELSVTQHSISIGGKTIAYTATAGTLVLRDAKDEPAAQFGFTAYVKKGVTDPRTRPITFAYNGGPGSSSIWLHMGVLGPRRRSPGASWTVLAQRLVGAAEKASSPCDGAPAARQQQRHPAARPDALTR